MNILKQEKSDGMDILKEQIKGWIDSNEIANRKFERLLRRSTILLIFSISSTLLGIGGVIYLTVQPVTVDGITMDQIKEVQQNQIIQRGFIEMDKKALMETKQQLIDLAKALKDIK